MSKVNGNKNITSGRDTTFNQYVTNANNQEEELGIINEIFNFVIEEAKNIDVENSKKAFTSDRLIHIKNKIVLNFPEKEEIIEVQRYFTTLFTKIHSVEKSFQTLDENEQQSIHFYISSKYYDFKRKELKPIEILKKLAEIFIPPAQHKNPTYVSIAQSIVLFFFDDCTIFEKTILEENGQQSLFENI
jgi:DNA primase catalytic subunit